MANFTVYKLDTGEIVRTGHCPSEMLSLQPTVGSTPFSDTKNEGVIAGTFDFLTQKIINGEVVNLSQEEKNTKFLENQLKSKPLILNTDDDATVNQKISTYFNGLMDINQYRKDNYDWFRTIFYPPISDYNDAQVKLNSTDSNLQAIGQAELDNYVQASLDVKARFPK